MTSRTWSSQFTGASFVGVFVLSLCITSVPLSAQTFTPVKAYSVAGTPLQLGYINLPNTTTTVYFPQGDGGQRSGTIVSVPAVRAFIILLVFPLLTLAIH
ncbi:MAG: hypothetical protein QM706_06290, partial [Nitrospira sp.]